MKLVGKYLYSLPIGTVYTVKDLIEHIREVTGVELVEIDRRMRDLPACTPVIFSSSFRQRLQLLP